MSKGTKQFISLLLLSSFAASTLACGAPEPSGNETSAVTTTTEETTLNPADARLAVDDELPDKDFEGQTYTILTYDQHKADVFSESLNGEVINDAVFERNEKVEERFNVVIEVNSQVNYAEVTNFANNTVMAGDDAFQITAQHVVQLGSTIMQGLYMNWYDIPHIDFSKPWWSPSTTNDLTYGDDKALIAVGDLALSSLAATYCYFYDKTDAETYKIEDLYDVVWDGKWTIDYVMQVTKDIYEDLNSNGERDEEDYYGMTQQMQSALNTYLWSCGGKVMQKNAQGIPELVYKTEKTNNIIEKLYQLCYESEGVCTARKFDQSMVTSSADDVIHYIGAISFKENMTLMTAGTLDMTINYFRDKSTEYGILPYPKYDEAQEDYYTMVDGYHAALAIPKSVQDLDFVGIITEALNAESYKIVFPAYYEVALKTKYAYDDESVQMLDMIVDSRIFDFGYVYDAWKGMSFYFQTIIYTNKNKDFESYYATNSSAAIKYYDELLEFFEEME